MANQSYQNKHEPYSSGNQALKGWIPVMIMLICFPPVGVLLLVIKLFGLSGGRRYSAGQHPEGAAAAQRAHPPTAQARAKAQPHASTPRKRAAEGKGLTIGGAFVAGIFGIAALGGILSALSTGGFWASLEEIFVPLGFCGMGLVMLYLGLTKTKKYKRYRKYLALIGRRENIPVLSLAQAMGVSIHRACVDLQEMLDAGLFPTGYLDVGSGQLVLNDAGLQDRPRPKAEPAAPRGMEREDAVLLEIRQLNDAIADPDLSRKIDRIGEIVGKIFTYLRENPKKEPQLRSFLSYYLPTTLKILRAYAQMEAQGIEGDNITAAKARIEGMMDKVVDGFESQLDKLFQDDAMDIATDVAVLERMLDKDGLGGAGMQLGG